MKFYKVMKSSLNFRIFKLRSVTSISFYLLYLQKSNWDRDLFTIMVVICGNFDHPTLGKLEIQISWNTQAPSLCRQKSTKRNFFEWEIVFIFCRIFTYSEAPVDNHQRFYPSVLFLKKRYFLVHRLLLKRRGHNFWSFMIIITEIRNSEAFGDISSEFWFEKVRARPTGLYSNYVLLCRQPVSLSSAF